MLVVAASLPKPVPSVQAPVEEAATQSVGAALSAALRGAECGLEPAGKSPDVVLTSFPNSVSYATASRQVTSAVAALLP
jgi:hypothetical protein